MKKLKFLMLIAAVPLIVACNGGDTPATSSGGDTPTSSGDATSIDRSGFTWTITFDSQGGSAVSSIEVKDGEFAAEPASPTYEGYVFQGWYKDTYAITPFDFETTAITADWTLYAGWERSLDPSTSSSQGGSSSSVPTPSDPYGPEGSELVEWYIVGAGTTFSGWNTSGGIQMYSNPGSTDQACILNVSFSVGDQWKITDGAMNSWIGYDSAISGTEYFEDTDGYNHNFGVVTAGYYDVYLTSGNQISIVAHTA